MRIVWQVEDGYAGGSRPHHLTVPDDELEGLSEEVQTSVIEGYVQDDFEQKVSFTWRKD